MSFPRPLRTPAARVPRPPLPATLQVALVDTETTGLYPSSDRIVEIAILLLEVDTASGRILGEVARYDALEDPGFPIPWAARAVHGISDAMVRGRRIDRAAVADLLRRADLLVAHNSGFDKGFVAQVCPEAPSLRWACSCRGVPWKKTFPQAPNARLQDLADAFNLPKGTAHRAMGDVETTLHLLQLPMAEDRLVLAHLLEKGMR